MPISVDAPTKFELTPEERMEIIRENGMRMLEADMAGRGKEFVSSERYKALNLPIAPPTDYEEGRAQVHTLSTACTHMISENAHSVRHPMSTPLLADWFPKGVRDTDLVYLTAKPGAGKTTLLCQIAHDFAVAEVPVCFMSGETPVAELVEERFWGLEGLPIIMPADSIGIMLEKAFKVRDLPLYLPIWNGKWQFRSNCSRFMDWMREHYKIKIFFFDHLRFFLNETDVMGNFIREERLKFQDTSEGMRLYAKDNHTALFVAVQPAKTPQDMSFQGSSMYGSGAMEQDATTILQLERILKKRSKRPEEDNEEHFEPWTELAAFKNRNGPSGGKKRVVINSVSKRIELYTSPLNEVKDEETWGYS